MNKPHWKKGKSPLIILMTRKVTFLRTARKLLTGFLTAKQESAII